MEKLTHNEECKKEYLNKVIDKLKEKAMSILNSKGDQQEYLDTINQINDAEATRDYYDQ